MGVLFIGLIGINFIISWFNAKSVGRIWSESKQIGGGTRILAVAGYVMAIIGFTMVYSILIVLAISYIGPMTGYLSSSDSQMLISFISDLSYVLIALAVIPTGIIIWINSLISFWKHKSLRSGGIAAWNTFANVRNIVSASRNVPSALARLTQSAKKAGNNGKGAILFLAVIAVICAILGGYFTASAIVKRSDKKYDLFGDVLQGQKFATGQ